MQTRSLLALGSLAIGLARAVPAHAVAASFTQLPLDGLIVQVSNSLINTWIPFIALLGLIGTVITIIAGHVHFGPKVARFVAGMALLSLGLPGLSAIFGGHLATSCVALWP
jgi:hypothetical protein